MGLHEPVARASAPVNVAGPPSVWNLNASTPEGVRVSAKFLNAVKYEGSVWPCENFSAGAGRVAQEDARSSGADLALSRVSPRPGRVASSRTVGAFLVAASRDLLLSFH